MAKQEFAKDFAYLSTFFGGEGLSEASDFFLKNEL